MFSLLIILKNYFFLKVNFKKYSYFNLWAKRVGQRGWENNFARPCRPAPISVRRHILEIPYCIIEDDCQTLKML